MCSQRILRRLRLVKSRRPNPKQPIQEVLRAAITHLQRSGKVVLLQQFPLSLTFVHNAKDVIRCCDAWKKHQTLPRLKDLIVSVHTLSRIGDIEAVLNSIPDQAMCQSARRSLYNIITKVARYHELAPYLYRMSGKHEAVRSMALTIVQLPQTAYSRSPGEHHPSTLASAFAKLNIPHRKPASDHLYRMIKVTEQQANEQFVERTRETLSKAKIHAEIQLIYHCELNRSELPPRVIASSKDACFLCNQFILMHGKFYTSRTHGRLYPGWRLPTVPQLADLEQRFNTALAGQIRASIAMLNQRGCRTVYPDPNESTLLTLPRSASTLRSALLSQHSVIEELTSPTQQSSSSSTSATKDIEDDSEQDIIPVTATVNDETNVTLSDCCAPSDVTSESSNAETSSTIESYNAEMEPSRLVVMQNHKTIHTAGRLELHIDATPDESDSAPFDSTKPVSCSVKRLTAGDAERVTSNSANTIIDVDTLHEETLYEVDDQGRLLVGARGVVVEIRYRDREAHDHQEVQ
jgi:hypothetical protein